MEKYFAQKSSKRRSLVIFLDLPSRRLHQLPVFNSRGTSGFAGSTIQAEVDVPDEACAKSQPAPFHLNHLIYAPARRIHFQAKFAISRTGIQTKTTTHAPRVVRPLRGFTGAVSATFRLKLCQRIRVAPLAASPKLPARDLQLPPKFLPQTCQAIGCPSDPIPL